MDKKTEVKFREMMDLLEQIVTDYNLHHSGGRDFGSGNILYPAEIHTIQAIGDNQGITVTSLAGILGVTKATVSERVNKLSRRGLVNKARGVDNAKEVLLLLSEDGRLDYTGHVRYHDRLYELFCAHLEENPKKAIKKLSGSFREFLDVAEKVNSTLDASPEF